MARLVRVFFFGNHMRHGIGRLRAGGAGGFSPASVFAGGAGFWLDPSDISTGFQDPAGLTPQTASAQTTGLRMDKHLALAPGAEMIAVAADRDMSSDTGFWSKSVNVAISGGKCSFTGVTGGAGLFISGFLTTGKVYDFTFTISGYVAGGLAVYARGNRSTTKAANGTYTVRVGAGSADLVLVFEAQGVTTLAIDDLSIKEITGSHVFQPTSSARPEYDVLGGISSDYEDGTDDGYSTPAFAAGALTNNMDCFIAVNRASANKFILASDGPTHATRYFAAADGVTASTCVQGCGAAWTLFKNGVQMNGTADTTFIQLNAAVTVGSWFVLEFRNLDLSLWTAFSDIYTGYFFNGDKGGVIMCTAQSAANRASIRKWLGAKVGLSL